MPAYVPRVELVPRLRSAEGRLLCLHFIGRSSQFQLVQIGANRRFPGHGLIMFDPHFDSWCPHFAVKHCDFTRGVWETGSLRRRFEALVKAHGEASTLTDGRGFVLDVSK